MRERKDTKKGRRRRRKDENGEKIGTRTKAVKMKAIVAVAAAVAVMVPTMTALIAAKVLSAVQRGKMLRRN